MLVAFNFPYNPSPMPNDPRYRSRKKPRAVASGSRLDCKAGEDAMFWSPETNVPVIFVDTESAFTRVAQALKDASVVGLDAEWRPRFVARRIAEAQVKAATVKTVECFSEISSKSTQVILPRPTSGGSTKDKDDGSGPPVQDASSSGVAGLPQRVPATFSESGDMRAAILQIACRCPKYSLEGQIGGMGEGIREEASISEEAEAKAAEALSAEATVTESPAAGTKAAPAAAIIDSPPLVTSEAPTSAHLPSASPSGDANSSSSSSSTARLQEGRAASDRATTENGTQLTSAGVKDDVACLDRPGEPEPFCFVDDAWRRFMVDEQQEQQRQQQQHCGSEHVDVVFILDLLHLPPHVILPHISNLFKSPAVLKLGFMLKEDLRMLHHTYPEAEGLDLVSNENDHVGFGCLNGVLHHMCHSPSFIR